MDLVSWLPLLPAAVPAVLRRADAWLCWRAEVRDGRPTKVPTSPDTGRDTDATAARWTFDQAVAGAKTHGLDGVGFALDGDHGLDLVGVDIDHCRDPETGEIHPGALEIVRALDSYAEVSPSATGLRVFVLGTKPGPRCKRAGAFDGFEVEVYDAGRYLTVTGHRTDGAPPDVRPAQEALADLYARIVPPEAPRPERPASAASGPTDADVLQRARAARNGAKFGRLYRGDASGYDDDQSSADLALVAMLAFWTQDPAQIDRIVRGSGLMRDKWDARRGAQTYGERTVAAALASVGETFDWSRSSGRPDGSPDADDLRPEPPADAEPDRAGPGVQGGTAIPGRVYDILPETFRKACAHFDAWHERDVFLTSLLGTTSAALPGVRFRYGRTPRYLSPHLYFFLLANGAGGKGVADFAFSWLDALDAHLEAESAAAHAEWSQQRDAHERAKRSREGGDPGPGPGPEPTPRFVVGGDDTTLGGLYDGLHANDPDGVAVLSTEADALSGSNRREFGGFSYLLRKAFHHERATESRRGTGRRSIKKPRLAVVVTGTFDQFERLLDSVQDGLYSRFGVYAFDTPGGYESQRPQPHAEDVAAFTEARAKDVLDLWRLLKKRKTPLYFDVPADLWDRVDAAFANLDRALFDRPGVSSYLAATVKRGAVIAFRIASVLAVWRAFDDGEDLGDDKVQRIQATPEDIDAAVLLSTTYAEHALSQAAAHGGGRASEADMNGADRMTGADRTFLDALPTEFGTAEMKAAAERAGFSTATAYRRVDDWMGAGLISKLRQGAYRKCAPAKTEETENPEKTAPQPSDSPNGFSQVSQAGEKTQARDPAPTGGFSHDSQGSQDSQWHPPGDGLATDPPDLAGPSLHKGARVRTPDGDGGVIQVFAERVTVLLDGHTTTSEFNPSAVGLLADAASADTPPAKAPF